MMEGASGNGRPFFRGAPFRGFPFRGRCAARTNHFPSHLDPATPESCNDWQYAHEYIARGVEIVMI
jgi:hypothetical protein